MRINFSHVKYNCFYNKKVHFVKKQMPIYDSVSFSALKKSNFKGIDLLVVNAQKAPIEKFNSNDDFQNFCSEKMLEIHSSEYPAKNTEIANERKKILKEWYYYLFDSANEIQPSVSLYILSSIVKNLKAKNNKLPPKLNITALNITLDKIENDVFKNSTEKNNASQNNNALQIDFLKKYQETLKNLFLNGFNESLKNMTQWIVIPSREHDSLNYRTNIEKLKALSCKTWCTNGYEAQQYLKKGNFHIYFEDGKPKLGIRFINDEIYEIQGEKNDTLIPLKYFDSVMEHIKDYNQSIVVQEEIEEANKTKNKFEELKNKIAPGKFSDLQPKEIFELFNIQAKNTSDNLLILSEYRQPDFSLSYEDFGIDENELFKNVKEIEGNADFAYSRVKKLANLERVGGNIYFPRSNITDKGNLKYVGGNISLGSIKIEGLEGVECLGKIIEYDDFNF